MNRTKSQWLAWFQDKLKSMGFVVLPSSSGGVSLRSDDPEAITKVALWLMDKDNWVAWNAWRLLRKEKCLGVKLSRSGNGTQVDAVWDNGIYDSILKPLRLTERMKWTELDRQDRLLPDPK